MALASQQGLVDSPNSSKMSTDAREVCPHHWSPYPSGRHSASESSKTTFGRYKEPVLYSFLWSSTLVEVLMDAFMNPSWKHSVFTNVYMGFLKGLLHQDMITEFAIWAYVIHYVLTKLETEIEKAMSGKNLM